MTTLPRSATVLRAAEMYFVDNMTMDDIGHALGCSRATVSRLVNEAKTSGLVEIIVHRKGLAPSTLERVIGDRYGVGVTVVAPPATVFAMRPRRAQHCCVRTSPQTCPLQSSGVSLSPRWLAVCRRESCRGCRSCK